MISEALFLEQGSKGRVLDELCHDFYPVRGREWTYEQMTEDLHGQQLKVYDPRADACSRVGFDWEFNGDSVGS